MKQIGKDHKYSDLSMSKRALELAEAELNTLQSWMEDKGLLTSEIGHHIHNRQRVLANLITERFYTLESLRRDTDESRHALVSDQGIKITDHAAIRYLQRIMGIDLTDLANEIVSKDTSETIKKFGTGRVVADSTVLIYKGKTVITIITKAMATTHRMKPIVVRKKVKRKKHNKKAKSRRYGS